jgi:hypothetical protein
MNMTPVSASKFVRKTLFLVFLPYLARGTAANALFAGLPVRIHPH